VSYNVEPAKPTESAENVEGTFEPEEPENAEEVEEVEDTTLSVIDRINRAKDWVVERSDITMDAIFHCTLGDTCSDAEQYAAASEHYRQAIDDNRVRHHALHGLATCEVDNNDVAAVKYATESLSFLRQLAESDELDEWNAKYYVVYLNHWGNYYESHGQKEKALSLYEEAFKRKPDDLSCCWTVLKLHCMVSEKQESALQLLEAWSIDNEKFGGQSPALSLLEMTEQDDFDDQLLPLVRNIKDEMLRTQILAVAAEAVALAGKTPANHIHCRLFYLRGVACYMSTSLERRAQAIQLWERTLTALPANDDNYWETISILTKASVNITKYRFDASRDKLVSSPGLTLAEKTVILQDLKDYFRRTTKACAALEDPSGADSAEGFIIGFCSLIGLHEDARQMCKREMGQALEILSDSDPDNDNVGSQLLARILCTLGDKVGALTAFSLLDRKILIQSLLTDGKSDTYIPAADKVGHGMWRTCDGCGKDMYSSDFDGIWWCHFCAEIDLCTACKIKHEQGVLRLELCNTAHVPSFLHLFHTEYTMEELESGKVSVDWEYEEDGQGGFSRIGGRIIDLSEWVENLRKLWDLPPPDGDVSRAQK